MTPRKFLNFLRSRPGLLLLFLLALVAALILASGWRKHSGSETSKQFATEKANQSKPQVVKSVRGSMIPYHPSSESAPKATTRQTQKPVVIVAPRDSGKTVSSNGLRLGEQIKEYHLGRYVDSSNRRTMHEAHPVYRIERPASWDQRPVTTGATPFPKPIPPGMTPTQ